MSMDDHALSDREEPALAGVERDLYDAVSAEEPWALVERFADLERVSGTADERRAAEYLQERLDAHGIPHERYDPELYLSVPESASLRVGSEAFDAVKTVSFSGDGTAAGELVSAGGDGSAAGVDDLLSADVPADLDVAGKVVLLEGLLPIAAIRELEKRGAAGVVVAHPHDREPHEGIATPVWGAQPHPDERDGVPSVPVAVVARPVGERLGERAGERAELTADVTTGFSECPLVVARIPGEADPDEEDFVLLHGHYDSWHVGVGDNATGDAGLLECARVFDEHRDRLSRDLWVAWWPGHSTGRYAGSTWFAGEFALDLRERCVAHVNMDSPGCADATEFDDMVAWMPEADALCRGAIADVCGKPATENRPPRAGDYSFNNLGVTGLFMLSSNVPREVREARDWHAVGGCGGNADAWHLSTDTLDVADPDVLVRDVRVYVTAVARLLRAEVLPLDFGHAVGRGRETVAAYDEAAGDHLDLGPVLAELDGLADALGAFDDAVGAGDVEPARANEALKSASRHLVRASFCTEGPFEQDPATDRPPYPALEPATTLPERSGDERRFLRTHLRRARNRVVHALREARRAVEAVTG